MTGEPGGDEIDRRYNELRDEAEAGGYHLNSDIDFTKRLVRGLIVNTQRYGYQACPCRLARGVRIEDLDIICPCDYRDPDLGEYGSCYCALYVSPAVLAGRQPIRMVPERRPPREDRRQFAQEKPVAPGQALPFPVWRCRVCGYMCARNEPPLQCPICKVPRERFERFI